MFSFVKKILLTGKNDISTLQKSLYCIAKQALLQNESMGITF